MSEKDRYPSELAERFQVRLPEGLRDRIRAAADANNRSMNSEIVATLMEAYPQPLDVAELTKRTRKLIKLFKKHRSTATMVELHNLLSELDYDLTNLENTPPADEDKDTRS